MVLGFGDLDLLKEQSVLQPHRNLDLEISSLNLLALQAGLGFVLNGARVFQTLLCSRCPVPLIKVAQRFPRAAVPPPGKEKQTPIRSVVCPVAPVSRIWGYCSNPKIIN